MSHANFPIFNGISWRLIGLGNADENVYPSKKSAAPPSSYEYMNYLQVVQDFVRTPWVKSASAPTALCQYANSATNFCSKIKHTYH